MRSVIADFDMVSVACKYRDGVERRRDFSRARKDLNSSVNIRYTAVNKVMLQTR